MTAPRQRRTTAACAVVFDARGRVLLQRRADDGRWVLPGGAVETGETAAEAVVREVREETGCDVEVVRLIGVYSEPAHTTITYPDGNTVSYVALCFECRPHHHSPERAAAFGEPPFASDETIETGWFDPNTDGPESLPPNFPDKHRIRLRDALAQQAAAFIR